ncbi:MAG: hypothetical protein SWX82_07205 [Cyanobacteriota bacterium]|nr:hypothetical protein [Cyanobacteriota bacterium]
MEWTSCPFLIFARSWYFHSLAGCLPYLGFAEKSKVWGGWGVWEVWEVWEVCEGRRQKAEGRSFVVYLCENRYKR